MKTIAAWCVTGVLAAASAAAQQPPVAKTPAPPDMKGRPSPQGFSVVLVLGELNGNSTGDVPPAARKALSDMKDFLPYKGYRLLDAEWILGSRGATTRLRGADAQDYELRLSAGDGSGRLHVSFTLLDASGDGSSNGDMSMLQARMGERAALEKRVADMQAEIAAMRARGSGASEIAAQEARVADLKRRLESADASPMIVMSRRRVIDTTFDMEIGETVVVGTSRLKDGKESKDSGRALIALLTAVPKSATSGKQD